MAPLWNAFSVRMRYRLLLKPALQSDAKWAQILPSYDLVKLCKFWLM